MECSYKGYPSELSRDQAGQSPHGPPGTCSLPGAARATNLDVLFQQVQCLKTTFTACPWVSTAHFLNYQVLMIFPLFQTPY